MEVVRGCRLAVQDGTRVGAAQARAAHKYKNRTGRLERSTHGRVDRDTLYGAEGTIEAGADYASFVERETRPHIIEARRARMLRWEDEGGDVHYARMVLHPGTEAQPFMEPVVPLVERTMLHDVEVGVTRAQGKLP